MTTDAEDRSTWPRNGQVIRRDELLRLIEENGGPEGLDLRGAVLVGDDASGDPSRNPIDLSPEELAPIAEAYREAHYGSYPRLFISHSGSAQLAGALLQHADLNGANLEHTNLNGARLEHADLLAAHLQDASLKGARLEHANLLGACLERAALTGAHLEHACLLHARLEHANLWRAHLDDADLMDARLDDASLKGARLEHLDLYDVSSLEEASWGGALLDHTRIKRESLGDRIGEEVWAHERKKPDEYHQAKEAYLLLKNNFNQIGRYEDASWAYVKEQKMEKMQFHWEWRTQGWRIWRAWGSFWRWLRNWAYELLTGYGERPWNPILAGAFTMLGFAIGFWATRVISNFWDALIYSLATFATFNLGRTGLNPEGRGVEAASSVEALLGIAVLALFVFTLGNRMSRS